MAPDIDLLPEITEEEVKKNAYTRKVNFAAITSLLVVGAILLGLFGYWGFLAANSQRLKSQIGSAEQDILSQSRKEVTRRSLFGRLEEAAKFVTSVFPYSEGVDKIIKFASSSKIELTNKEFDERGNMQITGKFVKPTDFNSLINKFTAEKESDTFGAVTLISLSKGEDEEDSSGDFVFTIGIKYLKVGLPGATASNNTDQ